MRACCIFVLVLWGCFGPACSHRSPVDPVAQVPPPGYTLELEDAFEAPGLDAAVWDSRLKVFGRFGDRFHNASYLNYLSDDDVLIEGGSLRLRAQKRELIGESPPGLYEYSAGMVSSHDRFAFTYGYVEIRARYPGGKGSWPCFWLMPQNHQWPPEFDIAEYYAGKKLMHLGLCHGDFPQILWDSGGNTDVDFEGAWNTFGLLWEPNRAVWIQNGRVKREVIGSHVPSIPMYVILSNGVSSRFGPSGEPDASTVFPNHFEIDFIRVWTGPHSVVHRQTPVDLHPEKLARKTARDPAPKGSAPAGNVSER